MIKNAFNYSTSSLYGIAGCGKDLFYRFLSREDYDWSILINITTQLWRKTLANTERDDKTPICLMVDDTDYPKRGIQTEMIGKVFSHVEHKMILGFKGLFLGITDGATQMLMDFCLVGEKGKEGYVQPEAEADLMPDSLRNARRKAIRLNVSRSMTRVRLRS